MKRESIKLLAIASLALLCSASCKKQSTSSLDNNRTSLTGSVTAALDTSECTSPYLIVLESVTLVNGNYEWVWSIQNPNPGTGNDSTVQDLSHWDIELSNCLEFEEVVSAATSTDGVNWTSFQPTYQPDKTIKSVSSGDVIKFDVGTSGSAITYYKLVIIPDLHVDMQGTSYYKSGQKTGVGMQCFPGPGCGEMPDDGIIEAAQ
ncbi:MAG: hypothetical protein K0R82_1931 [Flavipsychrobacter sp.]|jgi:hypothetical protein|nr:hypothetical protein [Flavipsychrobacter sp.]